MFSNVFYLILSGWGLSSLKRGFWFRDGGAPLNLSGLGSTGLFKGFIEFRGFTGSRVRSSDTLNIKKWHVFTVYFKWHVFTVYTKFGSTHCSEFHTPPIFSIIPPLIISLLFFIASTSFVKIFSISFLLDSWSFLHYFIFLYSLLPIPLFIASNAFIHCS